MRIGGTTAMPHPKIAHRFGRATYVASVLRLSDTFVSRGLANHKLMAPAVVSVKSGVSLKYIMYSQKLKIHSSRYRCTRVFTSALGYGATMLSRSLVTYVSALSTSSQTTMKCYIVEFHRGQEFYTAAQFTTRPWSAYWN